MDQLTDFSTACEVLRSFLQTPLDDGGAILERFAALPNARRGQGAHPLAHYVYVPGTREDRVLLIAHTDTVWDRRYKNPQTALSLQEKDGVLYNGSGASGLGADDRAGCAALWLLRESGHSLLLVDGEEYGHFGAKYILEKQKPLLRELNRHRYLVQFDLRGAGEYSFKNVPVTRQFERFVRAQGYRQTAVKGGTDVAYLCRGRCGVNLSIAYYRNHTAQEQLSLRQWYDCCRKAWDMLSPPQVCFRWSLAGFLRLRLKQFGSKCKRGLKKLCRRS